MDLALLVPEEGENLTNRGRKENKQRKGKECEKERVV